jgi:hypothetical protein
MVILEEGSPHWLVKASLPEQLGVFDETNAGNQFRGNSCRCCSSKRHT